MKRPIKFNVKIWTEWIEKDWFMVTSCEINGEYRKFCSKDDFAEHIKQYMLKKVKNIEEGSAEKRLNRDIKKLLIKKQDIEEKIKLFEKLIKEEKKYETVSN